MQETFIHPTAEVDPAARISAGCTIWGGTRIGPNARIGYNTSIGRNCEVDCIIGDNCRIQAGALLYDGVIIQDSVFIGPGVVTTNDALPRVQENGEDWDQRFQETLILDHAAVGANATIICGVTIGTYSLVAAGAVVTKDVKPFWIVRGNPASHTRSRREC